MDVSGYQPYQPMEICGTETINEFDKIPDEIVCLICSKLDRGSDVFSFILTCKRFKQLNTFDQICFKGQAIFQAFQNRDEERFIRLISLSHADFEDDKQIANGAFLSILDYYSNYKDTKDKAFQNMLIELIKSPKFCSTTEVSLQILPDLATVSEDLAVSFLTRNPNVDAEKLSRYMLASIQKYGWNPEDILTLPVVDAIANHSKFDPNFKNYEPLIQLIKASLELTVDGEVELIPVSQSYMIQSWLSHLNLNRAEFLDAFFDAEKKFNILLDQREVLNKLEAFSTIMNADHKRRKI